MRALRRSNVQASKSLAKRKREEAEAEAGQKEHRRLRQDMRRRGHVVSYVVPHFPACNMKGLFLQVANPCHSKF